MKQKRLRAGLLFLAAYFAAGTAHATTTYSFDSPTGNLGISETYTVSLLSITATAFTDSGSVDLYGKAAGGDENGLGLTNDPSGNHEITPGSFIQLNLTNVLGDVPFTITFGSSTGSDAWEIVQTNTAGTMAGGSVLLTGSNESAHSISPTDTYLDITATSGNILLATLTLGAGNANTIPEPSAVILLASGLLLVGVGKVRKKSS